MKAFVITIMDNPESVKMAQRCIDSAKSTSNIVVNNFVAITPRMNPLTLAESFGIDHRPFTNNRYSRPENCLSCFLSHFLLWKKSVDTNEDILIFEHDAEARDVIRTDVNFKGVLSYGQPSYGRFATPHLFGVNRLISKNYLPGAHAYMVSPKAAAILVAKAQVEPEPTDVFINNTRFDFVEEYYPWPVVANDSFSTVQNKVGVQAKHNYRKAERDYRIIDA